MAPVLTVERNAYLATLREALAALETARVVLGRARLRMCQ